MVYVETNTFSNYDTGIVYSGIESYYGSRNVLRNNTLTFCQFDQHGTADSVGARWWECTITTSLSLLVSNSVAVLLSAMDRDYVGKYCHLQRLS